MDLGENEAAVQRPLMTSVDGRKRGGWIQLRRLEHLVEITIMLRPRYGHR